MANVRKPAVAGAFYPAQPAALRARVEALLEGAGDASPSPPKAVIAPHAGYPHSGPVAASAFAPLRRAGGAFERVVLLGPAHYHPFAGLALSRAGAFETPLGPVRVDREAARKLRTLLRVRVIEEAHAPEHCLEVELPFLQMVMENFAIVPILAGDAAPEHVTEVIQMLWDEEKTLVVVSSDLSHYHDYETARKRDDATARAIESLDADAIGPGDACGHALIRGLLRLAREKGLRATAADLRNSGDTGGPKDRVVGYGAFLFG